MTLTLNEILTCIDKSVINAVGFQHVMDINFFFARAYRVQIGYHTDQTLR